jgi:hypothetical protein
VKGNRFRAAASAITVALAVAPAAIASGGPGGGGGGSSTSCALATIVAAVHADVNGNSAVRVRATLRDCTAVDQQHLHLNVSIPGSGTKPFDGNSALHPGGSLTTNASPIGSTPALLQFGHTYNVVATLSDTGTAPASVISTVTSTVTMPPGVVR